MVLLAGVIVGPALGEHLRSLEEALVAGALVANDLPLPDIVAQIICYIVVLKVLKLAGFTLYRLSNTK